LQLRRYYQTDGLPFGDMIWNEEFAPVQPKIQAFDGREAVAEERQYEDLLKPIFRAGKLVYALPSIHEIRALSRAQVAAFRKVNFDLYPIGLEPQLAALKQQLIQKFLKK
jgi:nicotinate phosphoribosyltransferase